MKKYELMLILPPDLGEDKTKKELDEVRKAIKKEAKGEILHEDLWGIKEFAYIIKKYDEGFYAIINFSAEPKEIAEFEKFLKLQQNILRFITVKTPENYEAKTLEQYEKEGKEQDKKDEEEKEKKEEAKKRPGKPVIKKPAPKPKVEKKEKEEVPKKPKKQEVKDEPKEEKAKEEPKEEKQESKGYQSDLKDVDEKLKSIIDDPDINL
jgi:small subunit ribosomal protein S6